MNRLGIVRDVPEEVEELIARKNANTKFEKSSEEPDSDTVAELSTPFSDDELRAGSEGDPVPLVDHSAPKAPDFVG